VDSKLSLNKLRVLPALSADSLLSTDENRDCATPILDGNEDSVRKITRKLKEIDVDEIVQARKRQKHSHRASSPSPSSSSSASSTTSDEYVEIALRCPNGERLCGKFHSEKTPFEILTEASSLVKFEYPITTEYYDCWINEVPRRKINPNQSLLTQQIQSRTMIYAEEK
jgi:hypothetical protein